MAGKTDGAGQAQLAAGFIAGAAQFGPGLLGRAGHGRALLVKALASIRQRQLARRAGEQGDAALCFELAYLLTDGRGAHAQVARRCAHGALLDDGGKNCHAFEIIHALIVKHSFKVLAKKAD